jgi:hypothetical protein
LLRENHQTTVSILNDMFHSSLASRRCHQQSTGLGGNHFHPIFDEKFLDELGNGSLSDRSDLRSV